MVYKKHLDKRRCDIYNASMHESERIMGGMANFITIKIEVQNGHIRRGKDRSGLSGVQSGIVGLRRLPGKDRDKRRGGSL
jgi:hypothetical protein